MQKRNPRSTSYDRGPEQQNAPVLTAKLNRIRAGGSPRVLDLFSGCGGFSLGFQTAACTISAAVELDPLAAASHAANFHESDPKHARPRDITATDPKDLAKELGLGKVASAFDILIGGPPCQAFTRVGRSKLREVHADHQAFRNDPRAGLYLHYLDFVEACLPLAVVLENVPDMLNYGGRNIADEMCEVLTDRGYVCGYTLLNAVHYGVPQYRDRVILIALHRAVGAAVQFPEPIRFAEPPGGYLSSRSVALKLINNRDLFDGPDFWHPPADADPGLPPAVTAIEALADFPIIDARAEMISGLLRRGARRMNQPLPSPPPAKLSAYATLMRSWPDFESNGTVLDHVIRFLPRDYKLFAELTPGDQYPQARAKAEAMFERALNEAQASGGAFDRDSPAWHELRVKYVPPYDPNKFPNKWRKMEADQPSRTLLAHLGKDSYTHIHYDSSQARTISVREAARLQSFPDGFLFAGAMNSVFRQIGNAIPPLLARAVAEVIVTPLTRVTRSIPKADATESAWPLLPPGR